MFEVISIIGLLTLALIALGIGNLIVEQRKTRRMIHDHVHGVTNYLAEIASECRTMRISQGLENKVEEKCEHTHGHHHN
jgi:hypothetical protein